MLYSQPSIFRMFHEGSFHPSLFIKDKIHWARRNFLFGVNDYCEVININKITSSVTPESKANYGITIILIHSYIIISNIFFILYKKNYLPLRWLRNSVTCSYIPYAIHCTKTVNTVCIDSLTALQLNHEMEDTKSVRQTTHSSRDLRNNVRFGVFCQVF